MTTPVTIALGRVGGPARNDADLRGRVLYLPESDVIVIPQDLRVHGWDCVVIAEALTPNVRLNISAADLAAAQHTVTVAAGTRPDRYAQLWLLYLWQRWRTGPTVPLAGLLVRHCRIPGTITILLAPAARLRVMTEASLMPHRLQERLADLVAAGVLTDITPESRQDGTYTLTIPQPPTPSSPTARKASP